MIARRFRLAMLGAVVATAELATTQARAQSNPGFFAERHFACHPPRDVPTAPKSPAVPRSSFVPLARKPAPPTLPIAPLVLIDVAVAEPIPSRPSRPGEWPSAPEPSAIVSAAQDWRCVGFVRGKAGILRVLRAPPLSRFAGHDDARSWQLLNARAASTARFVEALPELRKMLARPDPSDTDAEEQPDGSRLFDVVDSKLNAARALGDFDDTASAAGLRAHLRAREDRAYSLIWVAGVPALARLDPSVGEAYAAEVIERVAHGRGTTGPYAASDDTLLRAVLPLLRTPHPDRLALLRGFAGGRDRCDVLAARVRLGDVALRDELRADLATDLRTQRAVACYGTLMPDVFPGAGPDEVKTLLFRHRMEAILDLLHHDHVAPSKDPAWARARAELQATLQARLGDPDVAGGPSDSRYIPVKRARLLVALAELGSEGARSEVERLIQDSNDHRIAPWIAVREALRFDFPDAAKLAEARLLMAITTHTDRYDTDLDPVRGFVTLNDHTDVIDALAARGDVRFALGLLDRDRRVREVAAWHLARIPLAAACSVVVRNADAADEQAVQDAFWSLSMLGDACREEAYRRAIDRTAPPHVRGMALELSAMMRDVRIAPLLRDAGRKDDIRPARERARIIYAARE